MEIQITTPLVLTSLSCIRLVLQIQQNGHLQLTTIEGHVNHDCQYSRYEPVEFFTKSDKLYYKYN